MSLDINLTNVESTTNKKTTLTDNSDTFYPTQKAVKTAVDLKVDAVAGKGLSANDFTNTLKTKLDGIQDGAEVNVNADWNATSGDAQILNKPTIPNPSDFVAKSDYTPAHSILAQQSGTGSPTVVTIGTNEILGRLSGGASDIEGLSTSQVKTLLSYTTADIADSTNKRYVTDAQLVVIGNTSNTNTGDETQASILSKLGWFKIIDTTDSPTLTIVTTETIMKAIQLPPLTNGSKFKINELRVTKAGVSACTIRAYINNVPDNLSGAVQILSSSSSFPTAGLIATMERTFKIASGNIKGVSAATGLFSDKNQSGVTPLNAPLPTGTLHLIVTLQNAGSGESSQVELIDISNF